MSIGQIWDLIILSPMINVLIVMTRYLFNNFGIAIIALTILVNLVMFPLTLKQLKATQAMQAIQPKLAELQKKYAKDKQKLAQEQMRLYRESGMSPAGCVLPMLIQMPLWIALYQSINRLLPVVPEDFLGLSQHLYASWPIVFSMVPLQQAFLWFNLAQADTLLALLVGGSMWVQQKMTMVTGADPRQQQQARMMLWMMPMMFGVFALSFSSGLSVFWITSNVVRVVIQYFITGWGELATLIPRLPERKPAAQDKRLKKKISEVESGKADISAESVKPGPSEKEGLEHGQSGDKRQDRGGGHPAGFRPIRRKQGGDRGHRPKRG